MRCDGLGITDHSGKPAPICLGKTITLEVDGDSKPGQNLAGINTANDIANSKGKDHVANELYHQLPVYLQIVIVVAAKWWVMGW